MCSRVMAAIYDARPFSICAEFESSANMSLLWERDWRGLTRLGTISRLAPCNIDVAVLRNGEIWPATFSALRRDAYLACRTSPFRARINDSQIALTKQETKGHFRKTPFGSGAELWLEDSLARTRRKQAIAAIRFCIAGRPPLSPRRVTRPSVQAPREPMRHIQDELPVAGPARVYASPANARRAPVAR